MLQTDAPAVSGFADALRYLTTAGVVAAVGLLYRLDRRVAVMRVILTGESGNNGINGDVKALRSRVHDLSSTLQGVETEIAVHDQRLKTGGL